MIVVMICLLVIKAINATVIHYHYLLIRTHSSMVAIGLKCYHTPNANDDDKVSMQD